MTAITKTSPGGTLTRREGSGVVVWFTGLSCSGKTTIADALEAILVQAGIPLEVLDGDIVRPHLSKGLGFSRDDRNANVGRIAFVAHLLARNGVWVLVAAISPYKQAREAARATIGADNFVEVHVAAPLETCIARDTKGLYKRALAGEIPQFTGVSDPYEAPEHPAVTLDTSTLDVATSVDRVRTKLVELGWLEVH